MDLALGEETRVNPHLRESELWAAPTQLGALPQYQVQTLKGLHYSLAFSAIFMEPWLWNRLCPEEIIRESKKSVFFKGSPPLDIRNDATQRVFQKWKNPGNGRFQCAKKEAKVQFYGGYGVDIIWWLSKVLFLFCKRALPKKGSFPVAISGSTDTPSYMRTPTKSHEKAQIHTDTPEYMLIPANTQESTLIYSDTPEYTLTSTNSHKHALSRTDTP